MPTQSSSKHALREFINLLQISCYFHGKGVDVFLITNLTPMSTILSTLLNNILPDAGQFYSSREVSSQTLLMFHVIVDIFLKMEFSLHHLLHLQSNFLLCYLLQVICRDVQDRVVLLSSQIQDIC